MLLFPFCRKEWLGALSQVHSSQVEEPGCFIHPLFSKYLSSVDCKPGPVPDTGDLEMPKLLPVSSRSPQHGLPDHLGPRHSCWIPVALTSCPTHEVSRLLRVSLTYKPACSLRLGFCSGTPESWNISLVLHITRTQYNIFCEVAIVLTASQGCLFIHSTLTYWGTIMGQGLTWALGIQRWTRQSPCPRGAMCCDVASCCGGGCLLPSLGVSNAHNRASPLTIWLKMDSLGFCWGRKEWRHFHCFCELKKDEPGEF